MKLFKNRYLLIIVLLFTSQLFIIQKVSQSLFGCLFSKDYKYLKWQIVNHENENKQSSIKFAFVKQDETYITNECAKLLLNLTQYYKNLIQQNLALEINIAKEQDFTFGIYYLKKIRNSTAYFKKNNKFALQQLKLTLTNIIENVNVSKNLDEKSLLKEELSHQEVMSRIYISLVLIFGMSLFFLIFLYFRKQRLYKQKIEFLMRETNKKNEDGETPKSVIKTISINQKIVDDLLKKLACFEKEQQFLEKGITLNKLADQFKTNSTYLSKVINNYSGKSFSAYLNDLRIEYAINLLKNEKITQKYTIKALGEMTGFATTQHFSNAFQVFTGVKPSDFIEQLGRS